MLSFDANRQDGIAIPSILQPLFGLDFVPFLPEQTQNQTEAKSNRAGSADENRRGPSVVPMGSHDSGSARASSSFLARKSAPRSSSEISSKSRIDANSNSANAAAGGILTANQQRNHRGKVRHASIDGNDKEATLDDDQVQQQLMNMRIGVTSPPTTTAPPATIAGDASSSGQHSNDVDDEDDENIMVDGANAGRSPMRRKRLKKKINFKNLLRGRRASAAATTATDSPHANNHTKTGSMTTTPIATALKERLHFPNKRLFRRNRNPTWDGTDIELGKDATGTEQQAPSDIVLQAASFDVIADNAATSTMPSSAPSSDSLASLTMPPSAANPKNYASWMQQQETALAESQQYLKAIQRDAFETRNETILIYDRISSIHDEIEQLQTALSTSHKALQKELDDLELSQAKIKNLEKEALDAAKSVADTMSTMQQGSLQNDLPVVAKKNATPTPRNTHNETPLATNSKSLCHLVDDNEESQMLKPSSSTDNLRATRERAATAPSNCSSFMRIHDLDMTDSTHGGTTTDASSQVDSLSSSTFTSQHSNDLFYIDNGVCSVLDKLFRLGHEVVMDESSRFVPTKDTKNILNKYKKLNPLYPNHSQDGINDSDSNSYPRPLWHAAHDDDILIWTGHVDHNGFGSDWPMCKGRALIQASPRELLDLLSDSSQIKRYNKMSQGREDLYILQASVDTTEEESQYGFAGSAKITRSLNKPKLLPKAIEMTSLMHSKPLPSGGYMTVNRSVFEDNTGQPKNPRGTIQSEMLLGVLLMRPANVEGTVTELTTTTHALSSGVPEMFAKRAGPTSAYNMIRDLQTLFAKNNSRN